jgi:hypothetical protein
MVRPVWHTQYDKIDIFLSATKDKICLINAEHFKCMYI